MCRRLPVGMILLGLSSNSISRMVKPELRPYLFFKNISLPIFFIRLQTMDRSRLVPVIFWFFRIFDRSK